MSSNQANMFAAPEDPAQLVAWLERKRDRGRKGMAEEQMRLNLAYMLGKQWVAWDRVNGRFRAPTQNPHDPQATVRVTVNKVGSIVEHFIARLLRSAPEPQCRPVTDDDNDMGAARAATRILLHEMYRLQWPLLLMDTYFWAVPLGYAYAKITWDPDQGRPVTIEGDVREGEVALDVVPAFELAVDPGAKTMATARWAVHSVAMTKEDVWERYGIVPAGTDPARTLADDVAALNDTTRSGIQHPEDQVLVHQFWMLPCRAAPKGMVVTWAGKTILEPAKDFPYSHGRLPFVQVSLLPGIGRREGRTWVTDLVPLQADYNDARSREATLRRTITPKLTAPAGSINPRNITTRADLVLFNPVGEPPRWTVPDSGWVAQHETAMNRVDAEMGDRAGQSDVSSGKAPGASMAAAAILALQEADDTKMANSARLLAEYVREVGWHMLQLVRQFWTEERNIRVWSEAGTLEVVQLRGANITDHVDVHVEAESALPRSKAARVQLGMDLLGSGLPGTPASPFKDWRDFIRMLDLPGTDFVVDSLDIDAKRANRENGDLIQGLVRKAEMWDDHAVHIAEHERLRKSEMYDEIDRRADTGDPEAIKIRDTIDAHITVHYQLLNPALGFAPPPGVDGRDQQSAKPEGSSEYADPLTGQVGADTGMGTGGSPSALSGTEVGKRAGIGGPGEPGRVPGVSVDQQAASMGA